MSATTTKTKPAPLTLNQQDAAALLGVSPRTLSRYERDGLIRSKKVRRMRFYAVSRLKTLTRPDDDEQPTTEGDE